MSIALRPARESDTAFIVDTWRRSYEQAPQVRGADEAYMRRAIQRAVADAEKLLVACDSEDDDTLIGWLAASPPTLHYVYVRADFRRAGIARSLLDSFVLTAYSCKTLPGERRLRLAERGLAFTPRL